MAYLSTDAALRKIVDGGLYSGLAPGANISLGGGSIFAYCSSNAGEEIVGAGFFTGVGAQPLSSTGTAHPNVGARHANNVGARVGDLLVSIESSAGATPGRVTWHAVTASTFGGSTSVYSGTAGYDATVSAHAST